MAGSAETAAWVALGAVGDWIDERWGPYARLYVWTPLERALAAALEAGALRARGRDMATRVDIAVPPGASVTVRPWPWTGELVVIGRGLYRDAEISAESLAAWCSAHLGEPSELPLETPPAKPRRVRSKPAVEPLRVMLEEMFGDRWPSGRIDKTLVGQIAEVASKRGLCGKPSSIRRALGEGPISRASETTEA